jgi:hypothetical protein
VVAAARDRARYLAHMVAVEAKDLADEAVAERVQWESSLAEVLKRHRRQNEMSDRRYARRKECVNCSRFDYGAGPSGSQ